MDPVGYFRDGTRFNLIYSEEDYAIDIIASYIVWCANNNKKCFYFADSDHYEELDFFLNQHGHDLIKLVAKGRLVVDSAVEFFIERRTYTKHTYIIQLIQDALSEGFSGAAIIGDRDCFIKADISEEVLYEYEKSLNRILAQFPVSGLTCYNIDNFGVDTIFAITNLNPNFIYKRDNHIFVHEEGKPLYSPDEILGFTYFYLKEWQRMKNENRVYQFISKLSGEISYRKSVNEILQIALENICKTTYIDYGIAIKMRNGSMDKKAVTINELPWDVYNSVTKLIHEKELTKRDVLKRINYLTFTTDELDGELKNTLSSMGILHSALIPLKHEEELLGFLWLAAKNKYLSHTAFKNHTEFLFRVCNSISLTIVEYCKYKKIQEEFIQAREMKALGELSEGIAHEFNNLLMPIIGYTQMIKERLKDEELLKYISMVEDSAKDGARIISRIQEFSRNSKKEKELIDIDKAIVQSVGITKPKWDSGSIQMHTQLDSKASVLGVAAEVKEIFINIISNAVDAMPKGGVIKISSKNEDDHAVIRIADTGVGMSKEIRDRIFEPFFTTKGERGNGLGLAIISGITAEMKGTISVESEEGSGTEFVVRLPISHMENKGFNERQGHREYEKFSIMVIDDNVIVAKTVAEMIGSLGHRVQYVTDMDEILNIFKNNNFDCVFCDLSMGSYSGTQIAKVFKEARADVPFVLMTGWPGKLKKSELKDVDEIIKKPFSIEEISVIISRLAGTEN